MKGESLRILNPDSFGVKVNSIVSLPQFFGCGIFWWVTWGAGRRGGVRLIQLTNQDSHIH